MNTNLARKAVAAGLLGGLVLLGVPASGLAAEEEPLWPQIKASVFGDRAIKDGSDLLALDTPYRALDAAVTPITIKAKRPQSADSYIKTITLVVDENPSPVGPMFHFTPEAGWATIATRIRIQAYTDVRAIAETSDGQLYMVNNFVKAAGGCSAPPLGDMDKLMANLGKMKMKFLDLPRGGEPGRAQLLIGHPNFSGLQFNQMTRRNIPAHYVTSIEIARGETPVLSVEGNITMSQNPSLRFHFAGKPGDALKAVVKDSEGGVFEQTWTVPSGAKT